MLSFSVNEFLQFSPKIHYSFGRWIHPFTVRCPTDPNTRAALSGDALPQLALAFPCRNPGFCRSAIPEKPVLSRPRERVIANRIIYGRSSLSYVWIDRDSVVTLWHENQYEAFLLRPPYSLSRGNIVQHSSVIITFG